MTTPTIAFMEILRKVGIDQDEDFLRESVRLMSQQLMGLEVQGQTGAAKHERTPERNTQRNGYRERSWKTRVGEIDLRIPKLRTGSYFSSLLEPRWRAEARPTTGYAWLLPHFCFPKWGRLRGDLLAC